MTLLEWLLRGDPSVRWQVMRDLLDEPASVYEAERARIAGEGWGRRLLKLQCADGRWTRKRGPKGFRGLYIPKWTSTTYTLLQLRRMGLEPRQPGALRGCEALVEGSQWFDDGSVAPWASRMGAMSAEGTAAQRLPVTVARLRTWSAATQSAASTMPG